jgi:hypothetical protein
MDLCRILLRHMGFAAWTSIYIVTDSASKATFCARDFNMLQIVLW